MVDHVRSLRSCVMTMIKLHISSKTHLPSATISFEMSGFTNEWSGQLALVTGATGGIGRASCLALASLGCNVAIHFHQNSIAAGKLVQDVRDVGVQAQSFQADLSSYEETRQLHREVVSNLGHPSILFNNAGLTMGKSGVKDISEISVEEFEQTWRSNCGTQFLLTQLCMPAMTEACHGRVVFCSSVAAFTGGIVGPHCKSCVFGFEAY